MHSALTCHISGNSRSKEPKHHHKKREQKCIPPVVHEERNDDIEGQDAAEQDAAADGQRDVLLSAQSGFRRPARGQLEGLRSTAQHNTAHYSIVQYSTAQHTSRKTRFIQSQFQSTKKYNPNTQTEGGYARSCSPQSCVSEPSSHSTPPPPTLMPASIPFQRAWRSETSANMPPTNMAPTPKNLRARTAAELNVSNTYLNKVSYLSYLTDAYNK
jgi:hypothetical protein